MYPLSVHREKGVSVMYLLSVHREKGVSVMYLLSVHREKGVSVMYLLSVHREKGVSVMYPLSVHREKGAEEDRVREHEVYVLNKREQGDGHEEPAGLIVDVADVPGEFEGLVAN